MQVRSDRLGGERGQRHAQRQQRQIEPDGTQSLVGHDPPAPAQQGEREHKAGDADPLAAGGVLLEQLGQRYRDAGVADVTVKLYPAARHEILNETNRDEVTGDIVAWLRARSRIA